MLLVSKFNLARSKFRIQVFKQQAVEKLSDLLRSKVFGVVIMFHLIETGKFLQRNF